MVEKIFVPMKFGGNYDGPELGIEKLKAHYTISTDQIIEIFGPEDYSMPNLKNLDLVLNVSQKVAEKTASVRSKNIIPITIGGDHSISLGSISGVSSIDTNVGVIWIDAHADLNTDKTTPSGNIHGMILASLIGLGNQKLTQVF